MGLAAVPDGVEAALILLGDEPLIEARTLREVIMAAEAGGAVVATRFGDRIGPPVFLRRGVFDLAGRAVADGGLGPILRPSPGSRRSISLVLRWTSTRGPTSTRCSSPGAVSPTARIGHMFDLAESGR